MDNTGTTMDTESQDSSVIQELRNQLKNANKRVDALTQGKLATDRQVLKEAGFENITPLYEKELKDNPSIDPRTFLESYGLAPAAEDTDSEGEPTPEPVDEPTPDPVSGLAQQVASAGNPNSDPASALQAKIENATSRSELLEIINSNLA